MRIDYWTSMAAATVGRPLAALTEAQLCGYAETWRHLGRVWISMSREDGLSAAAAARFRRTARMALHTAREAEATLAMRRARLRSGGEPH
jgi:hypothetical protein